MPASAPLDDPQIPVKIQLAAAWTSFMFLYLYVDHLVLYKPGHLQRILDGYVWEFEVSQSFLVMAFTSVAIPALMILASLILSAPAVRITSLVVGLIYIPYSAINAAGETWTIFFGFSIGLELLLLAFILRTAWTWPRSGAEDAGLRGPTSAVRSR